MPWRILTSINTNGYGSPSGSESDFDAYLLRAMVTVTLKSKLYKLISSDDQTQAVLAQRHAPRAELSERTIKASLRDMRLIRRLMRTPSVPEVSLCPPDDENDGNYDSLTACCCRRPLPGFRRRLVAG